MTVDMQAQLTEMSVPLKLNWKEGKDMPFDMSSSIQAVVIGNNVYVGGGYSTRGNSFKAIVMVYSLYTGSWSTLLPYRNKYFGMAAVNNQLVLVGGSGCYHYASNSEVTNVLGVWDEGSQMWTHPYPKMPTSRHSVVVTTYQNWLIIAGGEDKSSCRSKTVELLEIHSGQWYVGSPLPNGYSEMSSAISGNMWYLSRGRSSKLDCNQRVFCVCLDELISQAVSQSAACAATLPSTPSPWQTLTDTPLKLSTILIFNGALLTVGGLDGSAIQLYQPSSRSWIKVGDLPVKKWECACVVLPSGEIFVAGGGIYNMVSDSRVDIATVTIHT